MKRMAMQAVQGRAKLSEVAGRIGAVMRSSASGPLIIAADVCRIADGWDSEGYREESGGMTCSQWLMRLCGQRERFFRDRLRAVERIGEHARRHWDHDAAVWASNAFDDASLERLDRQVRAEQRAAGEVVFSPAQVARVARDLALVKVRVRERVCGECEAKAQRIAELEAALEKMKGGPSLNE